MVKLTKVRAISILQSKKDTISQLRGLNSTHAEFTKWKRDVEIAIENVFGSEGRHLKDFRGITFYPTFVQFSFSGELITPQGTFTTCYAQGLNDAANLLKSLVDEIQEYWSDEESEPSQSHTSERATDRELMQRAIELAKKCVSEPGKVSPKVGAVLARDGIILGEAYRGELKPGEHAEYTLLERKLKAEIVAGATLFTTLEPCTTRNHPKVPCASRVADRKIAKVIIGTLDRNEDIRGRGEFHLMDAGIQIGRFDSDLMPRLEDLNREFIRDIRERTKTQTKDPVEPGTVGPNGFKIGYTDNGDKVEWVEEDGETWPMVLRRNDNHILNEYSELQDRVWYVRKLIMFEKMESGEEERKPEHEPFIEAAIKKMKVMEEKFGAENLVYEDIEWGIVQGKMAALAWVLGSDWEGAFDT